MTMSSMAGKRWDGRVTICTDARRTLSCVREVIRVAPPIADMDAMRGIEHKLLANVTLSHDEAFAVERLYRGNLLGMLVSLSAD